MLLVVFLVLGSVFSTIWWVPQLVRTFRSGTDGISAQAWATISASCCVWGVWATLAHQPVVAVVEFSQTLGAAIIVFRTGMTRTIMVGMVALVLVVAVCAQWSVLASISAVSVAVCCRLPQLWRLLRHQLPRHQVSMATWFLSAGSNIWWVLWGLAAAQPTMVWGAGVAVVCSTVVGFSARQRDINLDHPVMLD